MASKHKRRATAYHLTMALDRIERELAAILDRAATHSNEAHAIIYSAWGSSAAAAARMSQLAEKIDRLSPPL